jgi:hypothetical protein
MLKDEPDKEARKQKMDEMLKFLGSDPIGKIDKAFKSLYNSSVLEYLDLQ